MVTQHYYSYDEIHHMDGGVFTLGNSELRKILAQLLTCVPADVVDYLVKHCLVITTWQSFDGQYFPRELVRGKDIILLSEYTLNLGENERDKTILHELAHCWLKHSSRVLVEDMVEVMTVEEALKREKEGRELLKREEEADELVHKWSKQKGVEQDKGHS